MRRVGLRAHTAQSAGAGPGRRPRWSTADVREVDGVPAGRTASAAPPQGPAVAQCDPAGSRRGLFLAGRPRRGAWPLRGPEPAERRRGPTAPGVLAGARGRRRGVDPGASPLALAFVDGHTRPNVAELNSMKCSDFHRRGHQAADGRSSPPSRSLVPGCGSEPGPPCPARDRPRCKSGANPV